MGYDKRLSDLFEGNEIHKEDVIKKFSDYDGAQEIGVHLINTKNTNWSICNYDFNEIQQSTRKKRSIVDEEYEYDELDFKPDTTKKSNSENNVQEVWIHERFNVNEEFIIKKYLAPDLITSWIISAFSIHPIHGLAVYPPREIIARKQFFFEILAPYSIRSNEKTSVDVMVHNHIVSKETLDVRIKMYTKNYNESFLYDSLCSIPQEASNTQTKSLMIPYGEVKVASFYVQTVSKEFIKGM